MVDVTINSNNKRQSRLSSQLIQYPDGTARVLTMKQYEWDCANIAAKKGFPFNEVLESAQKLAVQFPSANGYDADVLKQTVIMVKVISEMLYEDKYPVANISGKY